MMVDQIQAELVRLQLHPVNLNVSGEAEGQVALHGSLLHYWKTPKSVDGRWFLDILRALPNAAGPQAVMTALCDAQATLAPSSPESEIAHAPPA